MKKLLCIFLCLICLTACSRNKSYANDIGCSQLYDGIADELDDGNQYFEFDSTHTQTYFPDTREYDDCYLVYSADVNDINEIGIFHAADEAYVAGILESCEAYIEDMQENSRAFISSYAPEELPKLDGAKVQRFGNYVVYLILPEHLSEEVLDDIEEMLTED